MYKCLYVLKVQVMDNPEEENEDNTHNSDEVM